MFLNYYIYICMFVICMYMYSFYYNNIMLILMILEFMMLIILLMLMNFMSYMGCINYIMYYLVFVVCESVLGLTLLLMLVRSKGNDNMKFLNLFLW